MVPCPTPDTDFPEIPYGRADFKGIRMDGALYVDKTRFIRPLERQRYVLFIRPRRFGKTCWLSMLECYYGHAERESFEAVFAGTDIGASPTTGRSRYLVLRFNFSGMDAPLDAMEERFEECCDIDLSRCLQLNEDLFDKSAMREVLAQSSINTKLRKLFAIAGNRDVPVYLLIDEYDVPANALLARHGEAACHALTHDEGFYRSFFATLEGRHGHRRAGALVHHGRFALGDGRRDQRLQHRPQPEPKPGVQRDAGFHGERGAWRVGHLSRRRRDGGASRRRLGHHARVVQRLPLLGGHARGRLQHGHGALLLGPSAANVRRTT